MLADADLKNIIQQGGVIAYPTEGVWGLGCDPFNEAAVTKILQLKQRDVAKGLILAACDIAQVKTLIVDDPEINWTEINKNWPGPTTYVFPASAKVPKWITGDFDTVAIRLSLHPVVQHICKVFGSPIVSTSANVAGQPELASAEAVRQQWGDAIDGIVPGALGSLNQPTQIFDARSLTAYR